MDYMYKKKYVKNLHIATKNKKKYCQNIYRISVFTQIAPRHSPVRSRQVKLVQSDMPVQREFVQPHIIHTVIKGHSYR